MHNGLFLGQEKPKRQGWIVTYSGIHQCEHRTGVLLPSVVVICCRLVLLTIPSLLCFLSVLSMVCIKSNTLLKHTAVARPSGWRRKASKERCLKDSYTIRNHLFSFFCITYYSCNAKISTCTKILYRLWR